MAKKRGFPMQGELVICVVKRLNPNSADVFLEEYGMDGMVHISEIVTGWVRNIKDHIKVGQTGVAKVIRVNEAEGYIALSLKRVDSRQEKEKLKEYNLDKKAEKMLGMAAEKRKKTLDQAYKEVGFTLQESFGSLFKAFKKAASGAEGLTSRGIPAEWAEAIAEVASKSIVQKEFEFRAELTLRSYDEDGLGAIKDLLANAEKEGVDVHYVSAPRYMLKFRTKDAKKGEREFQQILEKLESTSKKVETSAKMIE
ncbi:MAG: S1 RNA-binding domain-containing protein [Candidatus Aenigmarchaeota archaeon]|nr:S1 RNA-binding domain-containing protein [Candidatus Aenigmarchaeota archaeon]